MRSPIPTQAALIAAVATLCLWPGSAHAVQLAISRPDPKSVLESRLATVDLNFELVNTGTPTFKDIKIIEISQFVAKDSGDVDAEVLQDGLARCFRDGAEVSDLPVGGSCSVRSTYFVLDADPFDTDPKVDAAKWAAGIVVTYSFAGGSDRFLEPRSSFISIRDDPVPEPSAWTLMLAGFAATGAALRHSRWRRGRATGSQLPPA